jgi:two-component system, LytTR family, sensor kinase
MAFTQRWTWRGVFWYIAAWTPLLVLYAIMIGWSRRMPVDEAMTAALRTVVWSAVLGVGVLWLAQRWSWPDKPTPRFFIVHGGMALLYALLWDVLILRDIAGSTRGWRQALLEASPWIHWQTFEAVLLYAAICGFAWTRQAAERSRVQAERVAQADALRARAELDALRGRLDPHFLFNTLHTVTVLIRREPAAAEQAMERLSALLRYVLDAKQGGREEVPLADELAFTEAYLSLEALRLGDRLRIERAVAPETLECAVPSLVLQPLVENAIKHAIAPRATGGTLHLAAQVDAQQLVITVHDDGPGASDTASTRGTGVGLDALRQRLAARFGDAATVGVASSATQGFTVTVRLPA